MSILSRSIIEPALYRLGDLSGTVEHELSPRTVHRASGFELARVNSGDDATIAQILKLYDPSKRYLFIFDLDGTLRPNDEEPLTEVKAVTNGTGEKLDALNQRANFKNVILTARAACDISDSNLPLGINKYCNSGTEKIEYNQSKDKSFLVQSKYFDFYAQSARSLLKKLQESQKLQGLCEQGIIKGFYPGAGTLCLRVDFQGLNGDADRVRAEIKSEIRKNLDKDWLILPDEFPDTVVCLDKNYNYSKLQGLDEILNDCIREGYRPGHIFKIGDGEPDLEVMRTLKSLTQPEVLDFKVTNIAVRNKIAGDNAVDYRLTDHSAVCKLIDRLDQKVKNSP